MYLFAIEVIIRQSHVTHSCSRLFGSAYEFFGFLANWLLSDFYICISWPKKLLPLLYYHVMLSTKKHATHKTFCCFFFITRFELLKAVGLSEEIWCFFCVVVVGYYFRVSFASYASMSAAIIRRILVLFDATHDCLLTVSAASTKRTARHSLPAGRQSYKISSQSSHCTKKGEASQREP